MITFKTTATGIGISMQGTTDEFRSLYDLIGKIDDEYFHEDETEHPRHLMIMSFNYDIRHAFQDVEFNPRKTPASLCKLNLTWADILLYISLVRQTSAYVSLSKKEINQLASLDAGILEAMKEYDPKGAAINAHLLQPQFDFDTDCLFLIQHELHNVHIQAFHGKKGFRKLSMLMHDYLDYYGESHLEIIEHATSYAQKAKCDIWNLQSTTEYLLVDKW